MMKTNHIVFGVGAWGLCNVVTGTPLLESPELYAISGFGALINDIDTPKSWIGRRLLPIAIIVNLLVGHRGFTHSIIFILASISGLFYYDLFNLYTSAVLVGMLSHIAGDYMTREGVEIFWPLKRRYRFPFAAKTGGALEYCFSLSIIGWLCYESLSILPPA